MREEEESRLLMTQAVAAGCCCWMRSRALPWRPCPPLRATPARARAPAWFPPTPPTASSATSSPTMGKKVGKGPSLRTGMTSLCTSVCVCTCVCVRERERECVCSLAKTQRVCPVLGETVVC